MSFLLDTTVLSELRRRRPDPGVTAWFDAVPAHQVYLSVLSVGEIRRRIRRSEESELPHAAMFDDWLDGLVRGYADHIVPVTADVAQEWGRLSVPDALPMMEGLIAATAKVHDWTLVTGNADRFTRSGVRLHNPFTSPPGRGARGRPRR